jgi:hypothetical protein
VVHIPGVPFCIPIEEVFYGGVEDGLVPAEEGDFHDGCLGDRR